MRAFLRECIAPFAFLGLLFVASVVFGMCVLAVVLRGGR